MLVTDESMMRDELERAAPSLSRIVIMLAAAAAIGASGCFLGAAEFAPLMVQGAETTASGVEQSAAHLTGIIQDHGPNGSDAGLTEQCVDLKHEPPGVIELRMSAAGAPEYRELRPDAEADNVRWAPITDDDIDFGGWRPAQNLLRMGFNPPIAPAIPPAASVYLAYAPKQHESWSQQDHRAMLAECFGSPIGTFIWNKHPYDYVLVNALPCFPAPS
jgi:hypothetical protein